MDKFIEVAFKNKIKSFWIYIDNLRGTFDNLGIYLINIERNLKIELSNFINQDLKWYQLLTHQQHFKDTISKFNESMIIWKEVEKNSAGSNSHLQPNLAFSLKNTKISLLALIIWSKKINKQEPEL